MSWPWPTRSRQIAAAPTAAAIAGRPAASGCSLISRARSASSAWRNSARTSAGLAPSSSHGTFTE